MKKLFLSVIGMYVSMLAAFSQDSSNSAASYKTRKLRVEEINLVSSYYGQDGNNSAVTGGIGSEKLTDISNAIDLKLSLYDKRGRKHSFNGEVGIDHYTSASSDKIDPATISSASHADTRIYPSVGWTMENENKGSSIGAGISFSSEFDYKSFGGNLSFSKKTNNRNGEFTARAQAFLDQVTLIYPIELRTGGFRRNDDYATTARDSYSASLGWSQIINKQFQVSIQGDIIYQKGYLGLPFHRVYFDDGSVHVENLPSTRLKIPLGIRANYFIGDNLILRGWYRNYNDDWGIHSNTAQLETVVKVTPFFSITPFYRFYQQSAVKYFAPYEAHTAANTYYTSNYDLSNFRSNFFGAGFRIAPPQGVFRLNHFSSLELRYGYYNKSNGMHSNIISLNLTFR